MVFTIPAPAGHLKKNRFEFRLPGDEAPHSLPKLEYLPPEGEDYLTEIADTRLNEREFVYGLIERLDADLAGRIREARLSRDQVKSFYAAWMESGRINEVGKSSGSERS